MRHLNLLPSFLIGAVAGSRSMTPGALIAGASLMGVRTPGRPAGLGSRVGKTVALVLGLGELLGDKQPSAPDRTEPGALMARALSACMAGIALAPPGRARLGGLLAMAAAVPSAFVGLEARARCTAAVGPVKGALIEDVVVVLGGLACVVSASRMDRQAGSAVDRSGVAGQTLEHAAEP
ncbi:MAG: hypothetical protein V7672_00200 [Brevundimonas sp.]|uniref:hypothetical protein n=1 Tax=Brevundimonas sp. TaxID=1871086 RepID=UPI0030019D76